MSPGLFPKRAVKSTAYDLVLRKRAGPDETNTNLRFVLESNLKIGQLGFSWLDF